MQKRCDLFMMCFPQGKTKALTLSYDDGVEQDIRLVEIMKKNGLKGTFNINTGAYAPEGTVYPKGRIHRRLSRNQCIELYKTNGMEVAVHGFEHPQLQKLPKALCAYDVLLDRVNLEKDFDTIVRGMAYPFGTYNNDVVDILKQCGIVYSRTVVSTESFDIPTDWLRLPATCHHSHPKLMDLAREFVEKEETASPSLFYLWGHSYEFEENNDWYIIEEFAEYIGNRDDIWYATNIEIYDYITAYNQLVFSMDGSKMHNPTCMTLYFRYEGVIYCVKPGETSQL